MENAKTLKGKKILYKREYLDSLTSNVNLPNNSIDFDKALNIVTNPQIYSQHYDIREFYDKKLPIINK